MSEQVCREKWFPSHAHFLLLKLRRKIQNLRILKNCTAGSKNKATVGVRFVSISKWRRSKFWNQAVWILLTEFFLTSTDKIHPCHFFLFYCFDHLILIVAHLTAIVSSRDRIPNSLLTLPTLFHKRNITTFYLFSIISHQKNTYCIK